MNSIKRKVSNSYFNQTVSLFSAGWSRCHCLPAYSFLPARRQLQFVQTTHALLMLSANLEDSTRKQLRPVTAADKINLSMGKWSSYNDFHVELLQTPETLLIDSRGRMTQELSRFYQNCNELSENDVRSSGFHSDAVLFGQRWSEVPDRQTKFKPKILCLTLSCPREYRAASVLVAM